MHKLREILRLKWQVHCTDRQIATSCAVSRSTVSTYVRRAQDADLTWSIIEQLDDRALDARVLGPHRASAPLQPALPDWAIVDQELKRKGVTRKLLWLEYRDAHPDGLSYGRFCTHYRRWRKTQSPTMRQHHKAGEKLFVDYAGMTMEVIDRYTGEIRTAQIFVATLGASDYTFTEATWTQSLSDWLGSHRRAFEFYGAVPKATVPDNIKTGVTSACFYEPEINRSYLDLARHYNTVVIPTRVAAPRDKAKVENHVLIVERQILAPLRNRPFFSLAELNGAIAEGLHRLNHQPFQKRDTTRAALFEQLDKPAMLPLPKAPYVFAHWKPAKVHNDYHVELNRHFYSVPYTLLGERVHIRYTDQTVEIFHNDQRVASHRRQHHRGGHSTVTEHMPKAHQRAGNITGKHLLRRAVAIGPYTQQWVRRALKARPHPEQGFRTCLGALRLAKLYTPERLEAACQRALSVNTISYRSLQSILKNGLDRQPVLPEATQSSLPLPDHGNLRGPNYFN